MPRLTMRPTPKNPLNHLLCRIARLAPVGFVLIPFINFQFANGIWPSYGGTPQHRATSSYGLQLPQRILWQHPVDYQPQYSGPDLLIHYGSPLVSRLGTVILPVKIGKTDGFRVDGYRPSDGLRIWSMPTDYTLPAHGWTPPMSPAIVNRSQLAVPGSGGTIYLRTDVDTPFGAVSQECFYGMRSYSQNKIWADANVKICTPITADTFGNVWFGFRITGIVPARMPQLQSGIAHIDVHGNGTWISAAAAVQGDQGITQPLMNCAPALSNDGSVLYVVVKKKGNYGGEIVALDSMTLTPLGIHTALIDPKSFFDAGLFDDGTASPMIAPGDPLSGGGDVFFGVLENPFGSNNDRGWLLHFDAQLNPVGVPGAFGWDDTPSIVPSYAIRSYSGPSSYLICCKYNNYGGFGNGLNKLAILDPNDSFTEPVSGIATMNEIETVLGVTPDPNFPSLPGAVREWCVNTAAIDPINRCALVNSEDGSAYLWDFDTNTLQYPLSLTPGVGEAYTPTVIGYNGMGLAINNATLFAIGANPPAP